MKKLILLALISTFAISGFTNETELKAKEEAKENSRLCKIFTNKVEQYKSSMRDDGLAEATLVSYEERMDKYCSAPVENAEVKTVAEATKEIKRVSNTKDENERLCNIFIDKVENYEETMRSDDLAAATLVSYKERMSSFCQNASIKS
jgi:hypothetical protein